jgi:hypothetical protein
MARTATTVASTRPHRRATAEFTRGRCQCRCHGMTRQANPCERRRRRRQRSSRPTFQWMRRWRRPPRAPIPAPARILLGSSSGVRSGATGGHGSQVSPGGTAGKHRRSADNATAWNDSHWDYAGQRRKCQCLERWGRRSSRPRPEIHQAEDFSSQDASLLPFQSWLREALAGLPEAHICKKISGLRGLIERCPGAVLALQRHGC